jgi:hypothetical protein
MVGAPTETDAPTNTVGVSLQRRKPHQYWVLFRHNWDNWCGGGAYRQRHVTAMPRASYARLQSGDRDQPLTDPYCSLVTAIVPF